MNNTTTLPASQETNATPSGVSTQATLEKLNQLRAEIQQLEAAAAAEQRAEEERQRAAEQAREQTRIAELKELPAKYGFEDWRQLIGFVGFHFLRGQSKKPRQIKHRKFNGRVQGLDHAAVVKELKDVPRTSKSVADIARQFGSSRMSIYLIAHQYKVPLPSQVLKAA